jgi:hypothetical protein
MRRLKLVSEMARRNCRIHRPVPPCFFGIVIGFCRWPGQLFAVEKGKSWNGSHAKECPCAINHMYSAHKFMTFGMVTRRDIRRQCRLKSYRIKLQVISRAVVGSMFDSDSVISIDKTDCAICHLDVFHRTTGFLLHVVDFCGYLAILGWTYLPPNIFLPPGRSCSTVLPSG